MSPEPEPKRARQACYNCRRKKTRCRGERPACALCVRLGQHCEYGTPNKTTGGNVRRSPPSREVGLAARVAKLEAHLRAVQGTGPDATHSSFDGIDMVDAAPATDNYGISPPFHNQEYSQPQATPVSAAQEPHRQVDDEKFSKVPPLPVLGTLVDSYFANCHNQPYCYFHEEHLRRRISAGGVPDYLLLSIAATAARFSSHEYFEGRPLDAAAAMARAAWGVILHQVFATDSIPEVAAAQAIGMLAVIDFTAGHNRLGWVKIGLSVRLVQDLKLNAEPEPSLPAWLQEEHRRTFWSIYVLEKFVCCGKARPPAILDSDCSVALPCGEDAFRNETVGQVPTLVEAQDLDFDDGTMEQLDHFAMLVLMVSTLGVAIREIFQDSKTSRPPWDFRSNSAKISTIIMRFESMHAEGANQLAAYIAKQFGTYEGYDRQRVGHFIWARGVYHLCGCLLYHPLTIYRHRFARRSNFPHTFTRESLQRCQEHARQLTDMLQAVQTTGCCARGSFLGYLSACAASVHRLYVHSTDPDIASRAVGLLAQNLGFLEHSPVSWPSHVSIAAALRDAHTDPDLARLLIDPSQTASQDAASDEVEQLWHLIDYGWLCNPESVGSALLRSISLTLAPHTDGWAFMEGLDGSGNPLLGLSDTGALS